MVTIYITYEGDAGTRFDRTYYVEKHMPKVREAWSGHGLLSAAALFPAVPGTGTIAMAELRFRDEAAMDAAFGAPETKQVMQDVANFTDVKPARTRSVPF
jgi:uncharacterized protein (TIGR02118 family)